MDKTEKIVSIVLCILGFFLVVDGILVQFFNIGTEQKTLVIGYCVAFVLCSTKYKNILKKKYVVMPLYVMIGQMIYSLIIK